MKINVIGNGKALQIQITMKTQILTNTFNVNIKKLHDYILLLIK